ncbi:MAG: alpha/beta hydrolase family protein [Limnobacter sp.]|uniref:alpha/beta hydrolase family protein n=1 Tax=Limnobacter sp. TaxID=2003368 RepID=UPI0039192FDE
MNPERQVEKYLLDNNTSNGGISMRHLRFTLALLTCLALGACNSNDSTTPSASRINAAEVPVDGVSVLSGREFNSGLTLDLSCDEATYPSAAFVQCEARNSARTLEANLEQLNPMFQARAMQQNLANLQSLIQRNLQDPSWMLPPALGNTGVTPLCAAGIGPCTGDPFRYPNVDGPDGKTFYEQEAIVTPVVYYDQGCARISGQVWRPRNAGNAKLPAIVIKNGSVQASEQLYWWAAQRLVRAGYLVLTGDPRGQGRSDFSTPTGEQGGNFNGRVFFEGLVNDLDFLMSSPSQPYPHQARCAGTYPTPTALFNPMHAFVDKDRIGIAGHSYGAGGVTWVQSYGAQGSEPWPGLLSPSNPVKAIVAWDALGSSKAPTSATLTSLFPTGGSAGSLPENPLTSPGGTPPVVPQVPALGFTSEYGFTPVPFVRNPPRDEHLSGFKEWQAAKVPVMQVTVAGSTHLDYSLGSVLPASSWCPEIVNNACTGGWASPLIAHYTLAWFDRYLKAEGETGYADAEQRLLDDKAWAERLSIHFASARDFTLRDGRRVVASDIRALYK